MLSHALQGARNWTQTMGLSESYGARLWTAAFWGLVSFVLVAQVLW